MKTEAPVHRSGRPMPCPFCQSKLDAASPAIDDDPRAPRPGDMSMCIYCGEWIVFDGQPLRFRKPTDAEYREIATDHDMYRLRAAWVATKGGTRS